MVRLLLRYDTAKGSFYASFTSQKKDVYFLAPHTHTRPHSWKSWPQTSTSALLVSSSHLVPIWSPSSCSEILICPLLCPSSGAAAFRGPAPRRTQRLCPSWARKAGTEDYWIKWSTRARCRAALLTVPASNKALLKLPSWGTVYFGVCQATKNHHKSCAAFKFGKWRLRIWTVLSWRMRRNWPIDVALQGCSPWAAT